MWLLQRFYVVLFYTSDVKQGVANSACDHEADRKKVTCYSSTLAKVTF